MDRLGKYEIRGVLGRGAMGTVYEGWDPRIARRVAIKTVRLPDSADSEERELLGRFQQEAQAAGRLHHPNVVGVFDYAETDELAYIVMEFVDGRTLKAVLDSGHRPGPAEIGRLMQGLLEGLGYSHGHQVIHRDIKPANVIVQPDGAVKIADFGIARIGGSGMTLAGTIMGTPAYMSPEQFRGTDIDARSDIYSCGIVLFQLLTGKRPFEGSMATIMQAVLNQPIPLPSSMAEVPPALDAVVARAIARAPDDRFQTAAEFNAALQDALLDRTPAAPRPADLDDLLGGDATVVQPSRRPAPPLPGSPGTGAPAKAAPADARRSPVPLLLAGVAALAVLGGGGFWLLRAPGAPPAAPPRPAVTADNIPVARPPEETPTDLPTTAAQNVVEPSPARAEPPAQPTTPPAGTPAAQTTPPPQPPAQTPAQVPAQTPAVTAIPSPFVPPVVAVAPATPPISPPPTPPTTVPAVTASTPSSTTPSTPSSTTPSTTPSTTASTSTTPSTTTSTPPSTTASTRPSTPPTTPPTTPSSTPAATPAAPPTPTIVPPQPPTPPQPADPPRQQQAFNDTSRPPPENPPRPATPPQPQPQPQPQPLAQPLPLPAIAAALRGINCTAVTGDERPAGTLALTGAAGKGGGERALRDALHIAAPTAALDWQVTPVEGPYCSLLDTMRPLMRPLGATSPGLVVSTLSGRSELRENDLVVARATMPDYTAHLQLDYVSSDGGILHMRQSTGTPYSPNAAPVFGQPDPTFNGWEIGCPFGTDLVIGVASNQPLFRTPRPQQETVEAYLKELRPALDRLLRAGGRASASVLVLRTTALPRAAGAPAPCAPGAN